MLLIKNIFFLLVICFQIKANTNQNFKYLLTIKSNYINSTLKQSITMPEIQDQTYAFSIRSDSNNMVILESYPDIPLSDKKMIIKHVLSNGTSLYFENKIFSNEKASYFIEQYNPNTSFKRTKKNLFKKEYFFSNDDKYSQNLINKRDLHKTHLFILDKSIPSKYKNAVKNGVNYWNRYFHKQVLKVRNSIQEINHKTAKTINQIFWINKKSHTLGFANNKIDPLTGEILNSKIYLNDQITKLSSNVYLNLTTRFDERKSEKIKQSLVEYNVIHEIGHSLGLKHNFMGHSESQHNFKQLNNYFQELVYNLNSGIFFEKMSSNTFMDYLVPSDQVLLVNYIKNQNNTLNYDQAALNSLYYNRDDSELEAIPFCTDKDLSLNNLIKCKKFTQGALPVNFYLEKLNFLIEHVTKSLAQSLLNNNEYDFNVKKFFKSHRVLFNSIPATIKKVFDWSQRSSDSIEFINTKIKSNHFRENLSKLLSDKDVYNEWYNTFKMQLGHKSTDSHIDLLFNEYFNLFHPFLFNKTAAVFMSYQSPLKKIKGSFFRSFFSKNVISILEDHNIKKWFKNSYLRILSPQTFASFGYKDQMILDEIKKSIEYSPILSADDKSHFLNLISLTNKVK